MRTFTWGCSKGPPIAHFEDALTLKQALMAADLQDKASRNSAALVLIHMAAARREIDPEAAIRNAAEAAKSDIVEDRAQPRILAADAHRKLGRFADAETLLREAASILKTQETSVEANLTLAWAKLEVARGNLPAASRYVDRSIALDEIVLKELRTPEVACALAEALEFAAVAFPVIAPARRQRILAVWTDQDRRFPGHPYLQERVRIAAEQKRK